MNKLGICTLFSLIFAFTEINSAFRDRRFNLLGWPPLTIIYWIELFITAGEDFSFSLDVIVAELLDSVATLTLFVWISKLDPINSSHLSLSLSFFPSLFFLDVALFVTACYGRTWTILSTTSTNQVAGNLTASHPIYCQPSNLSETLTSSMRSRG